MSETKINFIYKDQKIEMNFKKTDFVKNILGAFALKIEKNIEGFNFLYSGEKISINDLQKLSDLNDKDDEINISVYPKNESTIKPTNIIIPSNLKFKESKHIICPKCKNMSEIDINNFKITLKNCIYNHNMSGFFMNDFVNTQYVDESQIKCKYCNKTEYELPSDDNNSNNNKLLLCSCKTIICQECLPKHNEENEKDKKSDKNKKHTTIAYKNKEYFCIDHNNIFSGYCHKCKRNICNKCEKGMHNKHRIDYFKKVSPKESFIQKIKSSYEDLISKVNKFNQELKELTDLIYNISNNIQNDLKIFLKITNNIIEDYDLNKQNYQTIQNIKNIYNSMTETAIFPKIDLFLNNTNSANRIGYILDMYNKMYLETSNTFNFIEETKAKESENIESKKEEKKKKESKKDVRESTINKDLGESYMILKYTPNFKKIKDNKMKIFGKKFVEKNKDNCILVINGKESELAEFYTFKKNDLKINDIEIKIIPTKTITDMSYMFFSDSSEPPIYLTSIINITNWNTSFVTDISNLFGNCTLLTSIPDISNWETINVTNISNLFYHCISLNSLPDISKWKIDNVTNMSYMFYDCKLVTSLPDISIWDTSKVTDMRGIFCNCSSLTSLPDISKWNTENVTNMSGMFHHCKKLTKLPDISEWNTGNVLNMGGMFDHCTSLQALPDISKWDTQNVTNLSYMFYFCSVLSSLPDISQWKTDNVKNMKGLFCNCNSLSIMPDISKWNTANVTNMSCMFYNCTSLLSLPDLMEWDISKVEDKKTMFTNCEKLPEQVIPRKFKI